MFFCGENGVSNPRTVAFATVLCAIFVLAHVHAGSADILFDQPRMAGIVLDQQDGDGYAVHAAALLDEAVTAGRRTRKVEPIPGTDSQSMVPPSRRTRAFTWARPIPSPATV